MLRNAKTYELERCPVAEEFLSTLLHLTLAEVSEQSNLLPEEQRGQLAVFCYRRAHMRKLGLAIARQCSRRSLVEEAGHAGELIHFQAHNMDKMAASEANLPSRSYKREVSLHKV